MRFLLSNCTRQLFKLLKFKLKNKMDVFKKTKLIFLADKNYPCYNYLVYNCHISL